MLRGQSLSGRFSLVGLLALLAIVAGLLGGGASAASRAASSQIDLRGVWDAPSHVGTAAYPQQWHITKENLTTGAYSGVDTSSVGDFSIVGTVSGNHLSATVSDSSYSAREQGTISSSQKSVSGTFTDSNGTSGTFSATRLSGPPSSGPPTTTPAPPTTNDQVCVPADCSQGVDETYDPSLDPGQTTDTTTVGCSSSRTTASARSASGLLCDVGNIVKDTVDSMGNPLGAAGDIQKALDQIFNGLPTNTGDSNWQAIQNAMQQINQSANPPPAMIQKILDSLQKALPNTTDSTNATDLQNADTQLAPDFPSGDITTASARAAQLSLSALVSPSLVLQSICSAHPSAASARAFKAEVKLATATTYSPARGEARLTLAFAAVLGQRALAPTLRQQGKQVILAQGKTSVKVHSKRKLTLVATPLGARVLRLLEIHGLGHKVHIQLVVSSTFKGKTSHGTRSISVR